MADLTISLDGTTDLPAGTIAAIVTSLEMRARPAVVADPPKAGAFGLARLGADDVERYLAIYRELGERWFWFSRLLKPRDAVAAIIGDAKVEAHVLVVEGRDAGLLELDWREEGSCELAFLGVSEDQIGSGAGRWLMNRAIAKAWARPIGRFWVHTCTLDHPGAIDFYRRSGFVPFRRGVEVVPDPRLKGALPRKAAAHHPIIE